MNATAAPTTKTNGRVAIVTGGTANLGKLFAESLADDGVNVVVHYNSPRRADEAAGVVNELEGLGVKALSHQADLTDVAEITRLVETTEQEYDESFAINSKVPYFLMREAYNGPSHFTFAVRDGLVSRMTIRG